MEELESQQMEGTVSSIIYQNEENGYTILRLDARDEECTVVGPMPGVSPGEYLTVRGRWVRHATYGPQFKAEVVERRLPQGLKEIYHYLASGAVKGVGKATARLLVEEFGEDVFQVIEDDPEQLTRIRGISPKRARQIGDVFRQQMGMQRLAEFLGEHGLPLELVPQLRRCYGDVALEALKANPYLLVGEEFGVDFAQADALALSLGVGGEDPQRLEAGLLFELAHNLNNGHSFLPRRKLIEATAILLDVSGGLLEEALKSLSVQELDRAVRMLATARTIDIYGVENSCTPASDLLTKLTYLGLCCRMHTDAYLQQIAAAHVGVADVAVAFSHSGCSMDTVKALRLARRAGANTIAVTSRKNPLLAKYADVCLYTGGEDTVIYGTAIFSRIPDLAVVDLLYMGIIQSDYERFSRSLDKSGAVIADRGYPEA